MGGPQLVSLKNMTVFQEWADKQHLNLQRHSYIWKIVSYNELSINLSSGNRKNRYTMGNSREI
jgi:hypothetical protein